jgi:hypothetical protein
MILLIRKIAPIYSTQLFEYQRAFSRVKSVAFTINLLYYHRRLYLLWSLPLFLIFVIVMLIADYSLFSTHYAFSMRFPAFYRSNRHGRHLVSYRSIAKNINHVCLVPYLQMILPVIEESYLYSRYLKRHQRLIR